MMDSFLHAAQANSISAVDDHEASSQSSQMDEAGSQSHENGVDSPGSSQGSLVDVTEVEESVEVQDLKKQVIALLDEEERRQHDDVTEAPEISPEEYAKVKLPGRWSDNMKQMKHSVRIKRYTNLQHVVSAAVSLGKVYSESKDVDTTKEERAEVALAAANSIFRDNRAIVYGARSKTVYKVVINNAAVLESMVEQEYRKSQKGPALSGTDGETAPDSYGAVEGHRRRVHEIWGHLEAKTWTQSLTESATKQAKAGLKRGLDRATAFFKSGKSGKSGKIAKLANTSGKPSDSEGSPQSSPQNTTPRHINSLARMELALAAKDQAKADQAYTEFRKAEFNQRHQLEVRKLDFEEQQLSVREKEAERRFSIQEKQAETQQKTLTAVLEQVVEQRRSTEQMLNAFLTTIAAIQQNR